MATTTPEKFFAPRDNSFIVSCMEDAPISGYIEVSSSPDFSNNVSGDGTYGFIPSSAATGKYHYNQFVPVDPDIAGAGEIVYWRVKNYTTGETGAIHANRLRRPRSHSTNWNFAVGGSMADFSGTVGINPDCKQYCLPTLLSLNPDFICIPGDLCDATTVSTLNTALTELQNVRQDLHTCGVNIPIFIGVGDEDNSGNTNYRNARGRMFPSAGAYHTETQVIRGPQPNPFLQDGNSSYSYYAFGYGNAFFVFFNDFLGGGFASDINATSYSSQKSFIETALKEHRHKYKWCFMFSHTEVDEVSPENSGGSVNTIAEAESTRSWIMDLHTTYKVNAHFSSHYHGWRVKHHENGTVYINCVLGGGTSGVFDDTWKNQNAFANVKIGSDEFGNVDPNKCKIDIVNPGITGVTGEILNTETYNNGVINFVNTSVLDHNDIEKSLFNSDYSATLVKFKTNWFYNAESTTTNPVDLVLTEKFMNPEYKITMWHELLSAEEKLKSWKVSNTPFYGGSLTSTLDSTRGFRADTPNSGATSSTLTFPFSWYKTGTEIGTSPSTKTPMYFINYFDVPDNISIDELQLIYQIEDAAYIWINGKLAWYSDGEGSPGTASPFLWSLRPELNSNKVNPDSDDFASNVIEDLEPIPNSKDSGIINNDSHGRSPENHYELQGQPIRITDIDVINSLKKTGNVIAVMLLQGRDIGETSPSVSTDFAFDLEMKAFGDKKNKLYAPHIKTPQKLEQFNQGNVEITWDINDYPYDGSITDSTENDPYFTPSTFNMNNISYEIEYTDNYIGKSTNWMTIKKRIPYSQSSYNWNVGKMIKSNSIRIRMRAKNSETEEYSDWSVSDQFGINVFELLAPIIVSPLPGSIYSNFIMIILDESLTKNTFHQKVRYTIEYSSRKQNIDWTKIVENMPFGQNIFRWDVSNINQSDDYIIRLTAKNFSTCLTPPTQEPDQIARKYVHNISIQQQGLFIIDTKPPQALIKFETNNVTNQLEQIVNIFAEDKTTQVETMQFRECDANSILSLGDLEDPYDPYGGCLPIEDLLESNTDLSTLIGKSVPYSTKIQWSFSDKSGLKKLEAIFADSGGNLSIQESIRVFLNSYDSEYPLTDFIITVEQRDKIVIDDDTSPPSVTVEPSVFEVVYFGNSVGQIFVLEPFARLLYEINDKPSISKIVEFNNGIYFSTYDNKKDTSKVYRSDLSEATLLYTFVNSLSEVKSTSIFNNKLYFGLQNGEVWSYNGFAFVLVTTFAESISTLYGDREYLYIGLKDSNSVYLYNGENFTELGLS